MKIPEGELLELADQALMMRQGEQARLTRISRYVRGRQDPPYAPEGVNAEYRWIMKKSLRNFLPLVISVVSQNLHVDGYRPSGSTVNQVLGPQRPQPEWDAFRANRMISRQHGVHRSVIKYGSSYVVVLPGRMSTDEEQQADVPVIRPVSPRRMTAFYADDVDDEWPQFAVEVRSVNLPRGQAQVFVSVYDEDTRYILSGQPGASISGAQLGLRLADPANPLLNGQDPVASHGMGVCPVVRFLYENDLDGETDCAGEVEPIMPIQDQINNTTFNLMMAEQYAAFRQRWVTGMSPADEEGREVQPFRPSVDRIFAAEATETRFGEFSETALAPYSGSREDGIRHMATITQIPPYHLLGQVANLSAEALAAARDGLDRKDDELKSILNDPWRNTFRLTCLARGDKDGWNDLFGSVIWRDTSARAFSATIDGLTKAAQMLGVPEEQLWGKIPGVTQDDVEAWRLAKQRADMQAIVQQAVSVQAGQVQAGQPGQPGQPGAQAAQGAAGGQASLPSAPGRSAAPGRPGRVLAPLPRGPGGRPAEPGA
jgi:hypothetical protein